MLSCAPAKATSTHHTKIAEMTAMFSHASSVLATKSRKAVCRSLLTWTSSLLFPSYEAVCLYLQAKTVDFFLRPKNLDPLPPVSTGDVAYEGGPRDGGGEESRKKSARSDVPRDGTETASRASNFFIGTRPLGLEGGPIPDGILEGTLGTVVVVIVEP